MTIHSVGVTKKYEFGCGKKFHIKTSTENDGSLTFSLIGEKNGSCSGVMMRTIVDLLNMYIKYGANIEEIADICKQHICRDAVPGQSSCVDKVARDILKSVRKD